MDVLGKRIENPVDYQSEGTKLISMYSGGTYDRGARVRYNRGARAWSAHDVRTVANG